MSKAGPGKRLGIRLGALEDDTVPVNKMLAMVAGGGAVKGTKGKVYRNIVDYLEVEGYPTESKSDFKEANINDLVLYTIYRFVFVIESKRTSVGEAMKQLLLSMKDLRDINGQGLVYGFSTTGDDWRMVTYDGTFKATEKLSAMLPSMGQDKERWMRDYSVLVDCMFVALDDDGGIVKKDVVV